MLTKMAFAKQKYPLPRPKLLYLIKEGESGAGERAESKDGYKEGVREETGEQTDETVWGRQKGKIKNV